MDEEINLIKGFDHFCKCMDFKKSFMDADAIRFMNEFSIHVRRKDKLLEYALEKLGITKEGLINDMKLRDKI